MIVAPFQYTDVLLSYSLQKKNYSSSTFPPVHAIQHFTVNGITIKIMVLEMYCVNCILLAIITQIIIIHHRSESGRITGGVTDLSTKERFTEEYSNLNQKRKIAKRWHPAILVDVWKDSSKRFAVWRYDSALSARYFENG